MNGTRAGGRPIAYRPEIDGLRALAVLPVMAFHAGLAGWQGGYLGVDVFFVISGYLITSIILADHAQGSFTLARFWERRARRILPLLTVVVLACLPAAWFLLGWKDAEDFAQSLVAVGVFASNLLFWREGNYFGPVAEFKPLLHTWSLAVEEQFYLLFPLACLLALKWGKRGALAVWLMVGLVVSIALAFALLHIDNSAAFYLLPARGWQLLAGALCALAPSMVRLPVWASAMAGLGGLVLIGTGMATPPDWGGGLGLPMLAVTLGAVAVILFAHSGSVAARLLSFRPLVAIGLVSYGAYLWHVPLLVFARYVLSLSANPELERAAVELPLPLALALCAASLLLAALTWRLVEQPFRARTRISLRAMVLAGVAAWAVILSFAATLLLTDWQQRFHATRVLGADPAQAATYARHMKLNDASPFTSRTTESGECLFASQRLDGETFSRIERCTQQHGQGVLLLGDSHAMNLHNVLANLASGDAFLVTIAAPACRIGYHWCFYGAVEARLESGLAGAFRQVVYTQAGSALILDAEGRPDRQAAFVEPESASFNEERVDEIADTLRDLQAAAGKPLLFAGPIYEPRINLLTAQPLKLGWVPRASIRGQFEALDARLAAASQAAGVPYASMLVEPLAPADSILDGDCLIYRDLDHLSHCGEMLMARRLRETGHPLARLMEQGGDVATPAR